LSQNNWKKINQKIIACRKCKRLVNFREKIARQKTKRFEEWIYWGKPVTGYGNRNGKLIILGLAPAAHGGNRTGRVFTGDKSADFLINCLHKVKLVNQPTSENKNDGLKMYNAYMTPVLKCVPPEDKPTSKELTNCSYFLKEEMQMLKNSKIFLALGKIAFDACVKFFKHINYVNINNKFKFTHGASYKINNKLTLIASYHPSPRNVNTGRLNSKKMIVLLKKIKKKIN
jgi:uracil-DNA glycosylase family 4